MRPMPSRVRPVSLTSLTAGTHSPVLPTANPVHFQPTMRFNFFSLATLAPLPRPSVCKVAPFPRLRASGTSTLAFDPLAWRDFHGHRQPDLRYPEGQHNDLLGLIHQRDGHAHRCRPHPHCLEDLRQYDVAPDRSVHRSSPEPVLLHGRNVLFGVTE
ncbi:hypothetical protein B0H14DRAFT_994527 [Mycena olivaceomarginata]|nr:hypothetical protein B0H14DRAFT_994527 [Mycena olivaceomarginata]